MVEEIQEIAKLLEGVSGDAATVIGWWFAFAAVRFALGCGLCAFVLLMLRRMVTEIIAAIPGD